MDRDDHSRSLCLPPRDLSRIPNISECSAPNGFHNYLVARLYINACFGGKSRCYRDEGRSSIENEIAAHAVHKYSKEVDAGLTRDGNARCAGGITGIAVSLLRVISDNFSCFRGPPVCRIE